MHINDGYQNPVSIKRVVDPSHNIHWHDNPEIITVLRGTMSLQIGFEKFILTNGDSMIVNILETHSYTSLKSNTEALFVTIDYDYCKKINPFFYESIAIVDYSVGFAQLQENRDKVTKGIAALLRCLPQENSFDIMDKANFQTLHEHLADLLNLISNAYKPRIYKGGVLTVASDKKIEMLYRMIHYLYQNYNKAPSLENFIKEEHYSLYYMSHVIVEITGTSFREWLTFVRVEESEKLLLATDLPISAVANEVGFSSVRYYNTNFKKWYGLTPVDFRRLFKHKYDPAYGKEKAELKVTSYSLDDLFPQHPDERRAKESHDKQEYTPWKILTIEQDALLPVEVSKKLHLHECRIDMQDFSLPARWEHLSWIKKDIDFQYLRIEGFPESTFLKEKESTQDHKQHICSEIQKYKRIYPELRSLQFSFSLSPKKQIPKEAPSILDAMNACFSITDFVTPEGKKTPNYYFFSLLKKLECFERFLINDWNIAAAKDDMLSILILQNEEYSLDSSPKNYRLIIKGYSGAYKLTTYKCDLDFLNSNMSIKTPAIEAHLSPSDYHCLNLMYEPRITFDLVSFENHQEIGIQLLGSSCQLLVFEPIHPKGEQKNKKQE